MNTSKLLNPEHLHVIFLESDSSQEQPKVLKQTALSFNPNFKVGDKLTFQQVKSTEHLALNWKGEDSTHTIKNLYWSLADYELEGSESSALVTLIITVEKIAKRVFNGPNND